MRVGFGPATGPTLKQPFAKSYVGGTYDKYTEVSEISSEILAHKHVPIL